MGLESKRLGGVKVTPPRIDAGGKKKKRRMSARQLIESGRYVLNPEFDEAEEIREQVADMCLQLHDCFEDYYPQDYKKEIPEDGAWIMVLRDPGTEYTVPPFSIWFAQNWHSNSNLAGVHVKRVKVITPMGELGLFPREYSRIDNVTSYIGREAEGILVHQLSGNPIVSNDQLHYIMSRGIPKQQAMLYLLDQIKDPTFLWIEIAPHYGNMFGKEWPSPARCPFATPLDRWHCDNPEMLENPFNVHVELVEAPNKHLTDL